MTDRYVPKLRPRFLEGIRIKGLQPKTMYLRAMRDFTRFLGTHRIVRRRRNSGRSNST